MKTYRIWYKDGSARLVTADSPSEAKALGRELAEMDAQDVSLAFTKAKKDNPDRARELQREWLGLTVVTKVEELV